MALAETAGAAYIGSAAANIQNFASFTPTANALIVAVVGVGNGNGVTPTSLAVTDTFGGTATGPWYQLAVGLEASGGAAGVWCKDAGASPTAGVVTATVLPATVLNLGGIVRQFTGALTAPFQVGSGDNTSLGTVDTVSVTPIFTGSQVVGAFGAPVTGAVTANASTTLYGQTAGAGGDQFGAFEATTTSTANTAKVVGFSATKATCAIAAAEILPATAVIYSIVGTIGAVDVGTSGAAITPSFGTGQSRTAGNLLVFWCTGTGAATLPGTPSGWNVGVQHAGTSCSATVYWKIAAGSDSAPTVALATSVLWTGQLAEFQISSGTIPSTPTDQSGSGSGTTSPTVATAGSTDATANSLVCSASGTFYSAAATKPLNIDTINNGVSNSAVSNAGTSSASHYNFGYGNTATNGAADSDSHAMTVTAITGNSTGLVSFKLPSAGPPAFIAPPPPYTNQAIVRGSFY